MKRTMTVLVALAVLAGAVVPATAAAQSVAAPTEVGDATVQAQMNETNVSENASETAQNATVSPGAMLAGTIGAQQAEFAGAVEHRAFGLEVSAAATNDSKAEVLARTQAHLHERSAALDERLHTLEAAHENGTISEAQYQAQATEIHAEAGHVRNMANSSDQVAMGLPEETLHENGVNATAIQELQRHAANMTGPEVARMAQHIAGPEVGHSFGAHAGSPGGSMMGMPGGPIDGMPGPAGHHWGNETAQTDDHHHNGQSGPSQTTTDDDTSHMNMTNDSEETNMTDSTMQSGNGGQ